LPETPIQTFSADGLEWTDARLWPQFLSLCTRDGEAIAVVDPEGREWRRSELLALAEPIIDALRAAGAHADARIMIEGRKHVSTMAAALAVSAIGGIICPYSPALTAADLSVLEARLGHSARLAYAEGGDEGERIGTLTLITAPKDAPRSADERDAQTALIGFTSGTTGVPKAVMHGPAALNYTSRACAMIAGLPEGQPILGVVPWDSAPGFTFTVHFALSLGHPLIVVDRWDPAAALTLAERYRCGWGICVPTHLFSMVEAARKGDWSGTLSIRALAVGGSAMTPELIADAEHYLGIAALRMFGMSECMGHASTLPDDPLERRQHSDGRSFPGTRDEAFDEALRMLPRGQRGQAGVKGPSLFLGYCRGLGDGGVQLTADGYFLTGDEIVCDADGYVKVVGRIKDQIIRGGYNIDPAEVEAAILRHPAILEVAVVAVPEARLGEQACAVCTIRAGHEGPDLPSLTQALGTIGLTKKKWPEHLVLVNEMRYTPTGKIDKKALAALAREALLAEGAE
jgi:acyl-CoA synthetase